MSHKPPICSKTRGATAGSGESQLSTELEGAGFARAPLSQADESGEAPWVAGSSGVVSVVCGGGHVQVTSQIKATWLRLPTNGTVHYMEAADNYIRPAVLWDICEQSFDHHGTEANSPRFR